MSIQQREFTRVSVSLHAELHIGGNVAIQGKLKNISNKGMFFRCQAMLPVETLLNFCVSRRRTGWTIF